MFITLLICESPPSLLLLTCGSLEKGWRASMGRSPPVAQHQAHPLPPPPSSGGMAGGGGGSLGKGKVWPGCRAFPTCPRHQGLRPHKPTPGRVASSCHGLSPPGKEQQEGAICAPSHLPRAISGSPYLPLLPAPQACVCVRVCVCLCVSPSLSRCLPLSYSVSLLIPS